MVSLWVSGAYLFGEEIGPYGGLVLAGELLVDVLVHEGGFPHPRVAQDDDLEQDLLATRGRAGPSRGHGAAKCVGWGGRGGSKGLIKRLVVMLVIAAKP